MPVAKVCWAWKVPLPLPSSTLTRVAADVGDDQVGLAVAVDVAPRPRRPDSMPAAKVCWALEGAVAVAQQHAHGVAAVVGDDQVGLAVAVHVRPRRRSNGCRAGGEGLPGDLEGAVAVAQQHAHGVVAVVGDDQVGLAVAVHVRRDATETGLQAGGRTWPSVPAKLTALRCVCDQRDCRPDRGCCRCPPGSDRGAAAGDAADGRRSYTRCR